MAKSVFSDTYDTFRKLLIEARQSRNLTQAELAHRLDRPQSYVSKYERGERRLDVVEFLEVAGTLELDAVNVIQQLQKPRKKRARR